MPRNWSKAVSEGNGPVPHQDKFGRDQPRWRPYIDFLKERFDRQLKIMESHFDQQDEKFDDLMDTLREKDSI